MLKELQKKYANIPTKAVELFKSLCQECQKKRKRPMTKGVVVRPILTKEFSSRGQVDLIDMQSMPSGSNKKWILVYQDHLTKFCILRALTSKRAAEVAFHLLDIFLLFGAPVVLQSDNGSEFTSQVITELKEVWPKLTLVHGKPRHPQSQGSVERANGDIKDMLVAWMADNDSEDWPTGIKFVQFQKNSALHSGIKCSPYSAMFGCEARVGLTTSSLPVEVIARMESEEDLLAVTPVRPDPDNDNSLSQVLQTGDGVTNQIHATSDETPAHDVDSPVSPEESEEHVASLSPSPSVCPVSSEENHRVAERIKQIKRRRLEAADAQTSQAERMVKRSRVDLRAGEQGDNVAVPVPLVDRGRGDPRNILGVIIDRREDTDQYRIAVKAGILSGLYSRNQFDLCPQRLLNTDNINTEKTVSLRSAVISQSASGGQGFTRCNCTGAKKCKTRRCKCLKAGLQCNSRCHSSLNCCNK
jgi:transposase InsO family protein